MSERLQDKVAKERARQAREEAEASDANALCIANLQSLAAHLASLYGEAPELALLPLPEVYRGRPRRGGEDLANDLSWHSLSFDGGYDSGTPHIRVSELHAIITHNPVTRTWRLHSYPERGNLSRAELIDAFSDGLAQWIVDSYPRALAAHREREASAEAARRKAMRDSIQAGIGLGCIGLVVLILALALFSWNWRL